MSALLQQFRGLSPSLIWALDEPSGSAADASGNGNLGSYNNAPSRSQPGMLPSVLLNGTNQSVVRDALTLTGLPVGSAARTILIFVKPSSTTAGSVLAYGSADNAGEHAILISAGTGTLSAFTDGVNVGNNKNWNTAVPTGVFTMLAMSYAGGAGGAAVFYQNETPDLTTTLSLNTTAFTGTQRLRAGLRSDDARATAFFAGNLAYGAIFPSALTQAQISTLYRTARRSGVVY